MSDTYRFAGDVLAVAGAGMIAVLANRITERVRIPAPLLMLVGAAVVQATVSAVGQPTELEVEHLVTLALVLVLFDGGMHIGWRRFRQAAAPIAVVGVVGTFATAAAGAAVLHLGFGVDWYPALLVATAVAPTDPAIVFSVLGQRVIRGRSSTILEGESGANDPVGIALMVALISAGGLSASAFGDVGLTFVVQMAVGAAVGAIGGPALLWFMRTVPLPSEALYPLRTVIAAFLLYGVATLAHGSGFLAVFVAGILIGDGRAPYKREIERFASALASLGEIVAFVVLGLTVDLSELTRVDVWVPGLILALALAVVARPLIVGLCLLPAHLSRNERSFVLFAGLKGAVPILLAEFLRAAHLPDAERLYGIVVVVVVFSVLIQGSLVPEVARRLKLPMHAVEPEPWTIGVRLRDEPEGVHRLRVAAGSIAEGLTLDEVSDAVGDIWVSIVVRDRVLVPIRPDTRLEADDDVVVLADPDLAGSLTSTFSPRRPASAGDGA